MVFTVAQNGGLIDVMSDLLARPRVNPEGPRPPITIVADEQYPRVDQSSSTDILARARDALTHVQGGLVMHALQSLTGNEQTALIVPVGELGVERRLAPALGAGAVYGFGNGVEVSPDVWSEAA